MPRRLMHLLSSPAVLSDRGNYTIYNDEFTSDYATGAVIGVTANGFPRHGLDGDYLSTSGGSLVVSGGGGYYGSPALIHAWGITRLSGLSFELEVTHGAVAARMQLGFGRPWNDAGTEHSLLFESNGRIYPRANNANIAGTDVAYNVNSSARYRIVLNAVGADYYRSTDGGASWSLLASDATMSNQALSCGIWGHTQAFTSSYMKLVAPTQIKRVAVLGDSITSVVTTRNWNYYLIENWTKGFYAWINHAVSGQTIISHMDAQTTAAATDNADLILNCLGVNDNNAGNMEALQAEIEENIIEQKASNPKATIIYVNALKVWTDVTGAVEQDKSNIRSAISAACTAQGISEVTTYDCPDYTAADTSDGVHPSIGGAVKLEAHIRPQIEALI